MRETSSKLRLAISNRCDRLSFRDPEVMLFFHALFAAKTTVLHGDLSIVFLDDAEISELHGRFLNEPIPTDVITFPGDAQEGFAGEICVSAETAWRESEERNIPFSRELCLYLAHGWLHLNGYDDCDEMDRRTMREAETEVLASAEKKGPLPAFSFS